MLEIILQGEKMQLLAERALYWPVQHTLIVADLHWGKSAHFRKHGIAITGNTQSADEMRLARLVRELKIERLVVAGDLFHSKENKETDLFEHWRNAHTALHIDLVTGNHDILPAEMYKSWNLALHEEGLYSGPFFIAHDVPEDCNTFCIHGHVHPAIRIKQKGHHPTLKLNCFCEDEHRFILPAFGQFTGNYILESSEHKHIYVIAGDEVLRWK